FAAIASWTDSAALAGSPVPPIARHVARENWYLPRYRPPAEIAAGLPPDSQLAIRDSIPALPVPARGVLRLDVGARTAERPSAPSVAGPAMPSTTSPWARWKRRT